VCPLCSSSFVECALKTYRQTHGDIFASVFQIKWMKRLNVTCVDSRSSAHNQTPLVNLLPAITITKMHHILNYLTLQVHEFLKTSHFFFVQENLCRNPFVPSLTFESYILSLIDKHRHCQWVEWFYPMHDLQHTILWKFNSIIKTHLHI